MKESNFDLYHYYDEESGPFKNISELSLEEYNKVMEEIKKNKPNSQCATRHPEYYIRRLNCEKILKDEFIKIGGILTRDHPYYMVVEESPWLETWFNKPKKIKININEFDLSKLSFTFGDSHPTFSPIRRDSREYRHKLYMYPEIVELIKKYRLPQIWNKDGSLGPERYIEVQIWDDEVIKRFK